MKKIINIILIITLFGATYSCDVLELNPQSSLSSATFFKTEKDAQLALTGIYSYMLTNNAFNHARKLWDGLSDVAHSYAGITIGNVDATNGGLWYIYTGCYSMIARCNNFLVNVDAVEMDSRLKEQYKGEVYFLRALSYFTLSEFWGGVPVYTQPPTIEESKIRQSPKSEVVELVLSDLDLAIASLPDVAYAGHAVKGSAMALKAKVLMHNEQWADAASLSKSIIDGGKFGLYTGGYPNLFIKPGQNNNPEIMFSVRYQKPDIICPQTADGNPDLAGAWDLTVVPLRYFIDLFQCTDGKPIDESPLYDPNDLFKNRDPRITLMAVSENHQFPDGSECNIQGRLLNGTGFYTNKYVDWNNYEGAWGWAVRSDQDFILIRYAEVLLMYAECQNEIAGPDASVYNAVNAIRTRPSVEMPELPADLSKDRMRQAIQNERLYELGLEGLRYWDLKRWKTIESVYAKIINPGGDQRRFDPSKHYVFPFSQSELDRNPNLVQNPNY